jgi:hypothetical protein
VLNVKLRSRCYVLRGTRDVNIEIQDAPTTDLPGKTGTEIKLLNPGKADAEAISLVICELLQPISVYPGPNSYELAKLNHQACPA